MGRRTSVRHTILSSALALLLHSTAAAAEDCEVPFQDSKLTIHKPETTLTSIDVPATFVAFGTDAVRTLHEYMVRCPSARPEHLMLSDATYFDMKPNSEFVQAFWAESYSDESLILVDEAVKAANKDPTPFTDPVNAILDLAASRVKSLTLMIYSPSKEDGVDILKRTWPRLEALTVRNYRNVEPLEKAATAFPSLTHLHIVQLGSASVPTTSEFLSNLHRLTHLRFSGAIDLDFALPPDLNPAYQPDALFDQTDVIASKDTIASRNLTLIVYPNASPALNITGDWAAPGIAYDEMLSVLQAREDVLVRWPSEEDYKNLDIAFVAYPLHLGKQDLAEWRDGKGGGSWEKPYAFDESHHWWKKPVTRTTVQEHRTINLGDEL